MQNQEGLHTVLRDEKLVSTNWGNEQDHKLINKIVQEIMQEDLTIGKALAVLDVARTALLGNAMDARIGLLRVKD